MSYVERFDEGVSHYYPILQRELYENEIKALKVLSLPGNAGVMHEIVLANQHCPAREHDLIAAYNRSLLRKTRSGEAKRALDRIDYMLARLRVGFTLRYEGYIPYQKVAERPPSTDRKWRYYAIADVPIVKNVNSRGRAVRPSKNSQVAAAGIPLLRERPLFSFEVTRLNKVELTKAHSDVMKYLLRKDGGCAIKDAVTDLNIAHRVLRSRCKSLNRLLKEQDLHYYFRFGKYRLDLLPFEE